MTQSHKQDRTTEKLIQFFAKSQFWDNELFGLDGLP